MLRVETDSVGRGVRVMTDLITGLDQVINLLEELIADMQEHLNG